MYASLVHDCKNQHGEGIFWNAADGRVWWTDIEGRALHAYEPLSGDSESYDMPDRVCCFAPCETGGFILAFDTRLSLVEDLRSMVETKIADFEPNNPNTRLNDGRVDRQGRFVAGGMNEVNGAADSSVIRVERDLSLSTLIDSISCANSICFTPDGHTMFFADTPDKEILAFDYGDNGVADRRQLVSFDAEPGLPDGSCVDSEGGVWNAEWEGRRVVRVSPDGHIDQIVEVPVWKPTCCAFGGPDMDTLYITTSRLMSDDSVLAKEPSSGGLFAVKTGFIGVKDTCFLG